jgi:hypothetical protein
MTKFTRFKLLLLALVMLVGSGSVVAQVNISAGTTITQDFSIGTSATATLPTGWKADKNTTVRSVGTYASAVTATERIGGNSLSTTAGNGIYNFGAGVQESATDRAIGGLSSSSASKSVNVYVQLQNNGGTDISDFTISYNVEKYRGGTNAAGFSIQMYYSTNGTTWTSAGSDFLTSFAADATNNGYATAPGSTVSVSSKTLSQSLAASSSLYLAWNYSVTSGSTTSNAQALSIDDVSIIANGGVVTPVVNTPTFDPTAGTYYSTQNVTISTETEGATIRYTTNGVDPTESSSIYSSPISVSTTTTIKAKAYKTEMDPSEVASALYTIVLTPTITVTEASVPAMSAQVGATDTETITVSGQNLSANIGLAVTGTNASLFTLSTYSIVPVSETVTDVVVTITYTPTAAGSDTVTLTLSSTGAADVTKTLTGSATWPPLATPVAENAGAVSQTGFTAIWGAVSGATEYELSVYTKEGSGGNATDLFISEYIEGSSFNKAIEIYNGTGASVDLSNYSLKKQTNGAGVYGNELTLTGSLTNGSAYLIVLNTAGSTLLSLANLTTNSAALNFNGNDAVGLFKSGTQIDEVGVFNQVSPNWGENMTLIRKSSVMSPKVPYDIADWDSFAVDYFTNSGSHTFAGGGSSSTQIPNSPFEGIGETSKAITGLTAGTKYYYTVIAKNANVDSEVSNEIEVETSFGTGIDAPVLKNITAFDGKIRFSATAGQVVEVYNAVGQKLMSSTTHDGLNTLPVDARGMLIVKLGNQVAKVIL